MFRFIHFCLVVVFALPLCCRAQAQSPDQDSLSHVLRGERDDSLRVRTMLSISMSYLGEVYPTARIYADSALSLALQSNQPALICRATILRALVHWHNGEYDRSISTYFKALSIAEKLDSTEVIGVVHHGLAMVYYYEADYEHALEHHQQALAAFRKKQDQTRTALVLNHIGLIYHKMGDYPNSIKYLIESSKVQQQIPGYSGRINSFAGESPFFRLQDFWQHELGKQLDLLAKENKSHGKNLLDILYNVASAYQELNQPQNALTYYLKARDYLLRSGRPVDFFLLGRAFREAGQLDSAIQTHRKGIEQARVIGTQINFTWGHKLLAEDYFQAGRYREALICYDTGLRLTSAMGNQLEAVDILQAMAKTQIALGNFQPALERLQESVGLAQRIGVKTELRDGLLLMGDLLESMGRSHEAYTYLRRGKLLADSITAGEADLSFAQMQVEYESEQKSADILKLNQEKEIQQAQISNKNLWIYSFSAIIPLCILLAGSVYWRYRQKNKANKILIAQKNQIETLLAEIHHRVKNNLQVISSLLSIQSEQLTNKNAKMAVLEGQSRVQAMGLIHENIYKAENFAYIDMGDYLHKLSNVLAASFGMDHVHVAVTTTCPSVDVDTAIPLGLIVNELITNSLKHAFRKVDQPRIAIDLHLDQGNLLILKVADNGLGFFTTPGKESFGLRLVKELAAQLGGTIDFSAEQGFCVEIRFRKFKLAA